MAGLYSNLEEIQGLRSQALRDEFGSFAEWLEAHHPRPRAEWVKLFRRTFVFTGEEITGEFLMSIGYLPGAHRRDCPVFARIAALDPPWMRTEPDTASDRKA